MRLNKFIAGCGVTSRRKADELIFKGEVTVNGQIVDTPGYNVDVDKDKVCYKGRLLSLEKKRAVYLFSKPYGVTCTMSDPYAEITLEPFFEDIPFRIYPVGRLDKDSTGLLVMTNDGTLTQKLSHPSGKVSKTYRVKVSGVPNRQKLQSLRKGILLEDGKTLPARIRFIKSDAGNSVYEVSIREGRNRQVRRMFEKIGHPVVELRRVAIGNLRDERLKDGRYRRLNRMEIEKLMEKDIR